MDARQKDSTSQSYGMIGLPGHSEFSVSSCAQLLFA
jgi:hypothetical protein